MPVDLSTCVPGQRLISSHDIILTYVGRIPETDNCYKCGYVHVVRYPNGNCGTRTNDGYVYATPSKRLPEDHDIVEIMNHDDTYRLNRLLKLMDMSA